VKNLLVLARGIDHRCGDVCSCRLGDAANLDFQCDLLLRTEGCTKTSVTTAPCGSESMKTSPIKPAVVIYCHLDHLDLCRAHGEKVFAGGGRSGDQDAELRLRPGVTALVISTWPYGHATSPHAVPLMKTEASVLTRRKSTRMRRPFHEAVCQFPAGTRPAQDVDRGGPFRPLATILKAVEPTGRDPESAPWAVGSGLGGAKSGMACQRPLRTMRSRSGLRTSTGP